MTRQVVIDVMEQAARTIRVLADLQPNEVVGSVARTEAATIDAIMSELKRENAEEESDGDSTDNL